MDKKYQKLSRPAYVLSDIVYRYISLISEESKKQIDYGTGERYTSSEVHTLSMIEDHPGITSTEMASLTCKTKGAVSQLVKNLEGKGLVRREKRSGNKKEMHLYLTPSGLELSKKHKSYDEEDFKGTLNDLITLFGWDAVEKFGDILEFLIDCHKKNLGKE